MKKKILICTLCFTLLFTSINNKKSYANPVITANPIISASLVYAIGHIAYDILGFVGDVTDIIDMGTSVYEKMTDKQKEDIKEQIEFNQEGFIYNESVKDIIIPTLPSKSYHFMLDFKRPLVSNGFYYDEKSTMPSDELFEKNKIVREYQGITIEYMLFAYPSGNGYQHTFTYQIPGFTSKNGLYLGVEPKGSFDGCLYSIKVNGFINNPRRAGLQLQVEGNINKSIVFAYVEDSCSSCPHGDFNFNPNANINYPSSEELDYIDKNYPNLKNDIYDKINGDNNDSEDEGGGSNGGGSNGGGSNGGGSNGGGSNGDINNPIINNPPSFPNLQEFDFSGLQLEPLSNLFSNFKNKFPFSLPFDLAHLIGYLNQDPVAPVFEADLFGETMSLDLTNFTELANILKLFVVLGYSVGLILLTKRFGG